MNKETALQTRNIQLLVRECALASVEYRRQLSDTPTWKARRFSATAEKLKTTKQALNVATSCLQAQHAILLIQRRRKRIKSEGAKNDARLRKSTLFCARKRLYTCVRGRAAQYTDATWTDFVS